MSHFKVAVVVASKNKSDVERLLAPFQENNMGDCPKKYLEFYSQQKEVEQEYENDKRPMVKLKDGTYVETYDNMFKKVVSKEEYENNRKNGGSRGYGDEREYFIYDYKNYELVEVPYKELYATLKDYAKEGFNFDEEMQEYGYWENPNAKWDYWQLGGRYGDELGKKIKDINFGINQEAYDENIRFWEIIIEGSPLREGEEKPFNMYKPEYYTQQWESKEEYARQHSLQNRAYALLTPDGKWYEKGEMGWFGMDSSSKEQKVEFLEFYDSFMKDEKNKDLYVFMVDCHI